MSQTSTESTFSETEPALPAGWLGGLARLLRIKNPRELERFLKFAVVGGIGFVIDAGVFNLLNALGWLDEVNVQLPVANLQLSGVGLAGMISFTLAVISNFIWNRYWTYPDSRSKPILRQFGSFFAINIVGILIRTPLLEGLWRPFTRLAMSVAGLETTTAEWAGKNMALMVGVGVVLFWNFFVNRYLTYGDVE